MIKRKQTTPTNSDCTASYTVSTSDISTVSELLHSLQTLNEWGEIRINDRDDVCVYYSKYNNKDNNNENRIDISMIEKDIQDLVVSSVKSHGGYSMMNYDINTL